MNLKNQSNKEAVISSVAQSHIGNDYSYQKMYEQERDKVVELRMKIVSLENELKIMQSDHRHAIEKLELDKKGQIEKILNNQEAEQKLGAIAEAGSLANQIKDILPMIGEVLPMIQGLTAPKYSADAMNLMTWFENLSQEEKILFGKLLIRLNAENNFLMNTQALLENE